MLISICNKHPIKLIHISTVYVNKGKPQYNDQQNNNIDIIDYNTKISLTDNYIYGAIKALAEYVIYKELNSEYLIVRLPVIMDHNIENLEDTSPTTVLHTMLFGDTKPINSAYIRYPNSAENISKILFEITEK